MGVIEAVAGEGEILTVDALGPGAHTDHLTTPISRHKYSLVIIKRSPVPCHHGTPSCSFSRNILLLLVIKELWHHVIKELSPCTLSPRNTPQLSCHQGIPSSFVPCDQVTPSLYLINMEHPLNIVKDTPHVPCQSPKRNTLLPCHQYACQHFALEIGCLKEHLVELLIHHLTNLY